ncbi:MAG: hypothetical protein J5855_05355 [Mailhella sp.]|nr:hypothetical protein [Mailhella sp.]
MNRFGTDSDMVIQTVEENGQELYLAIDSKGLYLTTAAYVGKAKADPNRYTGARANVNERLQALGLDAAALLADNQGKIKSADGGDKKKVNPIKASKRAGRG